VVLAAQLAVVLVAPWLLLLALLLVKLLQQPELQPLELAVSVQLVPLLGVAVW
jgi:hypothetical protein